VAEQTVEGVRNPEGGTKQAVGSLRRWTPLVNVAKGKKPHGRCSRSEDFGRVWTGELCRRGKVQGRMNPLRKRWGTAGDEAFKSLGNEEIRR